MNILIDTHIFLWILMAPQKLSQSQRQALESPFNRFYLSSISVSELMIKESIGKLSMSFDPIEWAKKSGLELLSYSAQDAVALKSLPMLHKDPFDRMLIAQAQSQSMTLMSSDGKFPQYGFDIIS